MVPNEAQATKYGQNGKVSPKCAYRVLAAVPARSNTPAHRIAARSSLLLGLGSVVRVSEERVSEERVSEERVSENGSLRTGL